MFENLIHTLTLEDSEEEPFIVSEKVQKLTGIKLLQQVLQHLETRLTLTDRLPLHQRYKLKIIQQFTYSKIRWLLSIYKLDVTWIKQSCDNVVTRFLRKWLNMHPGANISHMFLSHKRIGLNFSLPSHIYTYAKISTRSLMKTSADIDIRSLYIETQEKNIAYDSVIEKNRDK